MIKHSLAPSQAITRYHSSPHQGPSVTHFGAMWRWVHGAAVHGAMLHQIARMHIQVKLFRGHISVPRCHGSNSSNPHLCWFVDSRWLEMADFFCLIGDGTGVGFVWPWHAGWWNATQFRDACSTYFLWALSFIKMSSLSRQVMRHATQQRLRHHPPANGLLWLQQMILANVWTKDPCSAPPWMPSLWATMVQLVWLGTWVIVPPTIEKIRWIVGAVPTGVTWISPVPVPETHWMMACRALFIGQTMHARMIPLSCCNAHTEQKATPHLRVIALAKLKKFPQLQWIGLHLVSMRQPMKTTAPLVYHGIHKSVKNCIPVWMLMLCGVACHGVGWTPVVPQHVLLLFGQDISSASRIPLLIEASKTTSPN